MCMSQSRQKSYTNVRHKNLEFEVDNKVFLKESSMEDVFRVGRMGKLSPHFIGLFDLLDQIGLVGY